MTSRYFYILEDAKHGPVTPDEIRVLAQAGTIIPSTILIDRKTGMQFKAARVNGLFTNQDWRTKASAMSVTAERPETATATPLPTGPSANDEPPSISVNIDTSTKSRGTSLSYWKRTADRIAGLKWYIAIHAAVGIIAFAAACVSLSNQSESQLQSVNDRLSTLSQSQREEFWRGQLRSEESWETARAHTALQAATMDFFPGDNKIPVFFSYLLAFFLLLLLPKRRTADRILVSISTLLFFGIAVDGGQRNAHFMTLKHMASEVGEFEDKLRDREVSQVAALEKKLKDADTRIVDMNRQMSSLQTQNSNRPSPGESSSRSETKRTTFKSRVTCPECEGVGSKGPGVIDSAFGEKRRRKCGFCDGHGSVWGHFHEGDDPDHALPFQTDPRFMDNW
ncbi:MAG: hypothetical protein KDA96_20940 [Planctomycetaceae bacterium]|nr:hypothetical protein [Planctomycetaceae bacterium]